jgi:hypothetical protein
MGASPSPMGRPNVDASGIPKCCGRVVRNWLPFFSPTKALRRSLQNCTEHSVSRRTRTNDRKIPRPENRANLGNRRPLSLDLSKSRSGAAFAAALQKKTVGLNGLRIKLHEGRI